MPKRAILILVASFLGILAAVVGAVYALALLFESIALSVSVDPLSVRVAISGACVAAALCLYMIKKSRWQFLYGMLEIAIGLVANWQSLDAWFHPTGGTDMSNVLYSRLAVLAAGTYVIGRGISNAAEGFERFFPNIWPKVRKELAPGNLLSVYLDGYYQADIDVPTERLQFHIGSLQERISALQKKLDVAVNKKRDGKSIQKRIDWSREKLETLTARYEKEVSGAGAESSQQQ